MSLQQVQALPTHSPHADHPSSNYPPQDTLSIFFNIPSLQLFSSQQIPCILGYFLPEALEALYPSLSAIWLLWLWFRFFSTTFFCD